ncbi:hypothetical protein Acj61p220 [Acinetobacter phage Acj61]|jgi:uncharacterized membrane protein|uniref:Uncharacterized protein n=1 Tax=Acinetobacter phage Acj61 TaxID=760732 RepID=E5E4K1_9CAUD|nr:hypothetical protein Acj61p220 [Acinetobacter phage Acj61]ADG36185.1 hypothetical protein Acj61p220 [Acinetobacter phage Acj61]
MKGLFDLEIVFWFGILVGAITYTSTNNMNYGFMATGLVFAIAMLALVIGCFMESKNDS